jgi:hypothetical protein
VVVGGSAGSGGADTVADATHEGDISLSAQTMGAGQKTFVNDIQVLTNTYSKPTAGSETTGDYYTTDASVGPLGSGNYTVIGVNRLSSGINYNTYLIFDANNFRATLYGTQSGAGYQSTAFAVVDATATVKNGIYSSAQALDGSTLSFSGGLLTGKSGSIAGNARPFDDNTALVENHADNTKQLILSAASIATGTTRTVTFPDHNGTVAELDLAQSWTALQTFGAGLITSPFGSGGNCESFGDGSGNASATGAGNLVVGTSALKAVTSGSENVVFGKRAAESLTTGSRNTVAGAFAFLACTAGTDNTGFGNAVLQNCTGSYNTAFGAGALKAVTSGGQNTGVGQNCLAGLTTGSTNTVVGMNGCSQLTTASAITAMGNGALANVTTGSANTAFGSSALTTVTTGTENTAFGSGTLNFCTGIRNTGVGLNAGYNVTTGQQNALLGWDAGESITTGGNNVCCGPGTGAATLTTGAQNTLLGWNADTAAASTQYGVALGAQAACASNECAIGPNVNVQTGQVISSTSAVRARADFTDSNVDNTDATRKYRRVSSVWDTAQREAWRQEATGSAAALGFFGAAAVVRQNVTGTRTGTLAQLQTVVANLLTALANLGFITDSTT